MTDNRIAHYLAAWQLERDGDAFETPSSRLCYVRRGSTRAVLKIPNPASDEFGSADVLLHWGGSAARVLEHDEQALLIERALPGTTLADLVLNGNDDEATRIWCDTVRSLHTKPAPEGRPTVEQRGRSFKRKLSHPLLSQYLVDRTARDYFELCATQSSKQFLLHGDLNHFNILRDRDRGWIVIDPKGVVGELAFEAGTFLRNPIPHWDLFANPRALARRVGSLCDRLGLERGRVLGWCATQAVLSAVWSAEGPGDDAKLQGALGVAQAAYTLLGT